MSSNKRSGSTFDSFLEEELLLEDVEAVAVKRVLAWQLQEAMREQNITKQTMAKGLHTSRSQLDRLLDPEKLSVTLETIQKAAKVLNKRVLIQIIDRKHPSASQPESRKKKLATPRPRKTKPRSA